MGLTLQGMAEEWNMVGFVQLHYSSFSTHTMRNIWHGYKFICLRREAVFSLFTCIWLFIEHSYWSLCSRLALF